MVPWSLFSLFLAFQSNPTFVSLHSSAATWRGIFGWVIIIILSIVPLIGLVSLIRGSEEFGIIGVDCENYPYLYSNSSADT